MQLLSWLSARMTARTTKRRTPARYRPRIEVLEGRCLPSTLTVTSTADSGPGSLRYEIAAAKNKDTIVFAPSLDGQTITLTSGELDVTKNLTIQGPGAGQLTISGGGSSRVFEVANKTTVTLSGLTISNGTAAAGGGILVDYGGTLTINNSTLSSNTAGYYGGAIDNQGANLTISGCTLSGNSVVAGSGGAIRNENGGNLSISNSTLSGNSAPGGDGGAIYGFEGSTQTLTDCALSSNTAYDGGALYNMGTMAVSGCTLSSNLANDLGGAIYNYANSYFTGVLSVTNSVFSSNAPDNIFGYYSGPGNTFH
jgi:hypothetical protein